MKAIFLIFLSSLIPFFLLSLPPKIQTRIEQLVRDNPRQLSYAEYALLAETVLDRTPCNFLVFGVGRDSRLWVDLNKAGSTYFLEDNPYWLNLIKGQIPDLNAYPVVYNTKRKEWKYLLKKPEVLQLELPEELNKIKWDIIFVDAPAGWDDECPGRMKSIVAAASFAHAQKDVHVFVHDCDRTVEAIYSSEYLKDKNLIKTIGKLRHYHIQ
ncbi:hypothetical protein [Criblamydia sequanensis]|uniref:Conserved putative secreted protein n=1 Tax=Candidatus Criblamydia sequanensis CRIB-18 TaxID=1437425 RepID=A0A090D0B0_9BACT|nr:hypothetical protein [Criblamydia sequanensis]CDR33003.1 Conserved putative secreted protein [Criblamydia sequanensis CRIB-18]